MRLVVPLLVFFAILPSCSRDYVTRHQHSQVNEEKIQTYLSLDEIERSSQKQDFSSLKHLLKTYNPHKKITVYTAQNMDHSRLSDFVSWLEQRGFQVGLKKKDLEGEGRVLLMQRKWVSSCDPKKAYQLGCSITNNMEKMINTPTQLKIRAPLLSQYTHDFFTAKKYDLKTEKIKK